ncbi:MAG: ATP-grasp domain-containing protein [Gammaproteobacteria bacterium]|jgi:carbamoyl-phosphate synthase large subunit
MTGATHKLHTVAVTGMNADHCNPAPGLAVARCLREAFQKNIRIIGLGYDALDPGIYLSDYCDAGYLLPYPSSGEDALFDRLKSINDIERFTAIIPCLDAELSSMIRLEPRLTELGICSYLPTVEQLKVRNKDRLSELADRTGINYPQIHSITNASFFHTCQDDGWRYPMVVKGPFYDAKVVNNATEGIAAFRQISSQWGLPILVQKHIQGEECNLTALGDGAGNMLGAVMMKKRALTASGKAWAGVSTFDDYLHQLAAAIMAKLKWRGPLEVEVMRDKNGAYHLIEINPRFPAWIYLSYGVGRNLPAVLLDLIFGRSPPAFPEPKTGTMFIRYAQETIVPMTSYESIVIGGNCQHTNSKGERTWGM